MTTISLDEDIEQQIQDRIRTTRFDSPEEYVNFVLREVVSKDVPNEGPDERERGISEQLKDLGYL